MSDESRMSADDYWHRGNQAVAINTTVTVAGIWAVTFAGMAESGAWMTISIAGVIVGWAFGAWWGLVRVPRHARADSAAQKVTT